MIIEVKQVEPTLPLVIVPLPPTQGMDDYMALLASHGRMTTTYQDFGAVVIDEKQVEPLFYQQFRCAQNLEKSFDYEYYPLLSRGLACQLIL
jgi:hypothetical protein